MRTRLCWKRSVIARRSTAQSTRLRWARALADCRGVALLEVLITGVLLAISAVGLALMYSLGNTWVVAKGDDRVALALAQQKIEHLRAVSFDCVPVRGPGEPAEVIEPNPTCTFRQVYHEPAWTAADGDPSPRPSNRDFTRLTCVQYVSDTDFNEPPYAGGFAAEPCPPLAGPPTHTKRITVVVRPALIQADPVMVQAWITRTGP